jgi:heat shock protein HslJ
MVALAGCEGADRDAAFSRPDRRLEGTSWRLETLAGEPVLTPRGASAEPALTFKNGFATWTVGCNGFDARYSSRDDRLTLKPRVRKRIGGCEAWERPVETALSGKAMPYRREGVTLVIQTPQGELAMKRVRFAPVKAR